MDVFRSGQHCSRGWFVPCWWEKETSAPRILQTHGCLSDIMTILVRWGHLAKVPQTGWLNRNLLSQSSGDKKSEIKMICFGGLRRRMKENLVQASLPASGYLLAMRLLLHHLTSAFVFTRPSPCVCLCSLFVRIDGSTLRFSFSLDYLCKDLISKLGHILRCERLGCNVA